MADTAAWLRDSVLGGLPVRQWVLSLPWALRRAVAFDRKLSAALLRASVRAVTRHHARLAGPGARFGAVTVIQRFGGALNLNPHFHTLVPQAAFHPDGQEVRVEHVRAPTLDELARVLDDVVASASRILARRGLALDLDPVSDALARASEGQRQLLGPRPGAPVDRHRDACAEVPGHQALTVQRAGFSLNAVVFIPAEDPDGLERLCRYVARPAIAQERLRLLPGDRVALTLRHPWRDGTRELVFDPLDFIARVAALVPAPRSNLVRHHGVFAPASPLRGAVVRPPEPEEVPRAVTMGHPTAPPRGSRRRRLAWAALMMRVFGEDVLRCDECGGRLRLIAHIEEPAVVVRILRHLGLPTTPPPIHPARPPPGQLDWVA